MSATGIGSILKEARTKKSLSLDEVHAKIKIHPRVIQILEEGRFEKLPSPLFAKSFLRSYAEFLGVNPDEVMDAYGKEGEAVKKEPDQVLFIKSVDEKKEESWAHANLLKVSLLIAALILGGFVFSYAAKNMSGWTQKMLVRKSAPVAAKIQTPEIKRKEVKRSEDWVRSVDQGNFPKISKKTPLELRLRSLDNVWVKVTADGKTMYQGILGRNAVETWTAKETLELWTGNASNMFLSVNRYALGSPGRGMVRKMIITHEGVRIPTAENR